MRVTDSQTESSFLLSPSPFRIIHMYFVGPLSPFSAGVRLADFAASVYIATTCHSLLLKFTYASRPLYNFFECREMIIKSRAGDVGFSAMDRDLDFVDKYIFINKICICIYM